MIVVSAEFL